MAELDLVVDVAVKGQQNLKRLSGDLGRADDQAKKAATSFGGIGSTLGSFITPTTAAVAAVGTLTVAMGAAASAALEEEKGIAALTASLRANDPAAANHIDAIEETIRQRENLAFADDEQRESLAALVSVTKDANKALALQRTAMDLARLKGISLASASELLGKVYGGNVGILSRYGIQLERGTSATEALAEIQRRAAGQAEEFANTSTGAIESMNIVFDDVVEDIGALLLPVLRDLALFVRDDLLPTLREMAPVFEAIGDGIGFVVGLINHFVNPFGVILDEQKKAAKETDKLIEDQADSWESYSQTISDASFSIEAAAEEIAKIPRAEIEAEWDDIRAAAFETTIQYQLGILDGQNQVKQGFEVLTRLQEEEQTKAQRIAYLQGQLNSEQLASGLTDKREGVRGAAEALRGEIIAELASLGVDAYNSGLSVPSNVAAGINANAHLVDGATSALAAKISGYLPRSNADVGPLSNIEDVGHAIVSSITDGMYADLGKAGAASGALAGALSLSPLSPLGDMPSGGGQGPGGITVEINVDGDLTANEATLPGTMIRGLFAAGLTD